MRLEPRKHTTTCGERDGIGKKEELPMANRTEAKTASEMTFAFAEYDGGKLNKTLVLLVCI